MYFMSCVFWLLFVEVEDVVSSCFYVDGGVYLILFMFYLEGKELSVWFEILFEFFIFECCC